jgi:hypothetical protein
MTVKIKLFLLQRGLLFLIYIFRWFVCLCQLALNWYKLWVSYCVQFWSLKVYTYVRSTLLHPFNINIPISSLKLFMYRTTMSGFLLDLSGSGYGQVVYCCEHGNEPSDFIKDGGGRDYLRASERLIGQSLVGIRKSPPFVKVLFLSAR